MKPSTVADKNLAKDGHLKMEWAESRMPVLMALRERYSKEKPLAGQKIAGCLHVTKETGVLIKTLEAAGAEVYFLSNRCRRLWCSRLPLWLWCSRFWL